MTTVRRVVHVIAPSPVGGAESVVLALASAGGGEASVIILNQVSDRDDPQHPLTTQLRNRGIRVDEVRCGRRRYRREVQEVRELLRQLDARVVHTHGYHGTWVGFHAARGVGAATVATVHGYLTRSLKERFYNVIDRRLLRRFDIVIAVSRGIQDQLVRSGVRLDRIRLIRNGMSGSASPSNREAMRQQLGLEGFVCGWIGRLSPEKGADLFLRALAGSDDSVSAVIVGDGPEAQGLKTLATRLGLSGDRVRFAGFMPDASATITAFDALALTSRTEGTPMVILEAIAAGVPVISFAVGGIPDLLDDAGAWIVQNGDVRGFATALSDAARSVAIRRERARIAQQRLPEEFTPVGWRHRVRMAHEHAVHIARAGRTPSLVDTLDP